jgi:HAD superfamily hydrolase (TIGR01509 family)
MVRQKASGIWGKPNEGARKTLDALVRLGVRRAVVSNSDGRAERHLIDCGVRDGIELVVDSQVVGVEKPDPRIFRIALEALGVAAERALFVGDIRSVDEAGARAAGVHFVLIDPFGDYAAPGTPAISGIGELPDHLAAHFHIVSSAPGGAAQRAAPTGGRAGDDS